MAHLSQCMRRRLSLGNNTIGDAGAKLLSGALRAREGQVYKIYVFIFHPPPQNRCQGAANLLTHFLYSPHPSCMPLSQRPSSPSFFTGNTLHTQTYTTTTQRYESTSLD